MESIIDQVQRNCPKQLQGYTECVEAHPKDWDSACAQKRRLLRECSEKSVGVLRRVKEECKKVAFDFDQCQSQQDDPMKCVEALKALHACAERVRAAHAAESK